jgi:hypothetical protein
MKLVSVKPSNDGKTKFMAEFQSDAPNGKKKIVKFGVAGSFSYVDGASLKTREAYRARHAKEALNEDPTARGPLSYWITWGDSQDINKNIAAYKRRYYLS